MRWLGMFTLVLLAAPVFAADYCQELRNQIATDRALKDKYQTVTVVHRAWNHAEIELTRTTTRTVRGTNISGQTYDSVTVGIRPDTYRLTPDEVHWVVHAYVRAMQTNDPVDTILAERCPSTEPGSPSAPGAKSPSQRGAQ